MSNIIYASTINIAVAANVSYAMNDLIKEFNEIYPKIKVRVILGSSGNLTAQIMHGANYSLFMSANMLYPNKLYQSKYALTKPIIYAKGLIVLFSIKDQDMTQDLNLLASNTIRKVAIANPKTAPYGKAAKEALENIGLYNKISKKIIYGQSISQTVSYSITAADIGIIAKSSLYSRNMRKYKKDINWRDIDPSLYKNLDQGIVLLKSSLKQKDAKLFYKFILNNIKAKNIFIKYGYLVP
jgi:molybdate transport system substrate-binding protein